MNSHVVSIEINDDELFEEENENFFVTISSVDTTPRLQLDNKLAAVNIIDTDSELIQCSSVADTSVLTLSSYYSNYHWFSQHCLHRK